MDASVAVSSLSESSLRSLRLEENVSVNVFLKLINLKSDSYPPLSPTHKPSDL